MKNTINDNSSYFKKLSAPRRTAFLGILTALAVSFSFIESLVPALPFMPPGAKAGFSNIITMYTAFSFGLPCALTISIIKSFFVLITRGGAAFLMSLAGGVISVVVMWIIYKSKINFGFIGIGITGAVFHNYSQLCIALLITNTPSLIYYLPALTVFAVIAGIITGILLKITIPVFYILGNTLFSKKG